MRFSKFIVPEEGGFAKQLAIYLEKVKKQLDKHQGKVWYTGNKHEMLKAQFMGKNTLGKLPHDIAVVLSLGDPEKYSFHSFRRTSATNAADAGSSTEQMADFYGWKNGSMCQEYISTSKPAILGMANRLAGPVEAPKVEPEREVELELETKIHDNMAQEVCITPKQELNEYIILEKDPEMYAMAGLDFMPLSNPTIPAQQAVIDATVKQAISAVTANVGVTTVNLKIVVVNNMTGTNNF